MKSYVWIGLPFHCFDRLRGAHLVKESPIKDKSFLVFTILSLTTLPAICEVPQTHLLHPGLVMAFLNVHVGLQLSEEETKGGRL